MITSTSSNVVQNTGGVYTGGGSSVVSSPVEASGIYQNDNTSNEISDLSYQETPDVVDETLETSTEEILEDTMNIPDVEVDNPVGNVSENPSVTHIPTPTVTPTPTSSSHTSSGVGAAVLGFGAAAVAGGGAAYYIHKKHQDASDVDEYEDEEEIGADDYYQEDSFHDSSSSDIDQDDDSIELESY